jgi:hypothetical protein
MMNILVGCFSDFALSPANDALPVSLSQKVQQGQSPIAGQFGGKNKVEIFSGFHAT